MPVQVVKAAGAQFRNGVGAFVQPCSKIVLRYCNAGGSSVGMRKLLREQLPEIAKNHPQIEFVVSHRAGHPLVQGYYPDGVTKTVCVRNFEPAKILQKIQLVSESSGAKLRKYDRAVESKNTSVRGIWSPFHVDKEFRHKV